ncbi:MAG: hypothetical protein HYY06_00160 [Deltaproteobacteria bacterium]|nr:hypothetical protein [Deltaproteobacteria bacterium]
MAAQQVRIDGGAPLRLSWGALFGGATVAAGSWVLLHALCFAAGLSGVAPSSAAELKAAAIGSGVWAVIVAAISLFVGGLVTGRSSGAPTRGSGALHGIVLWGLSAVGGMVLMTMAASSALGTFVEVGGQAMGRAAEERRWHGLVLGVDSAELLDSVNESLVRKGKQPANLENVEAALDEAMGRAFHEGRATTETLVTALMEHTALAKKDAEEVVRKLERQRGIEGPGAPPARGKQPWMGRGAPGFMGPPARMMSALLWAVFASMLLSLGAAVAGAMLGVPRRPLAVAMQVEPPLARPGQPSPAEKATPPEA